ncbi:hypothetical protein [Brucella pituitosa]|uniref:Uncharacterized protein n=1 Tax=Brucella pituitosa TaxID=571256 RepID=A0A643F1N8_9HYPH|nr:hypothetical protein [Brucella pituitosa]KAB0571070.1 hypothetical protein F7Q93_13980 [Brucella pituitosa]
MKISILLLSIGLISANIALADTQSSISEMRSTPISVFDLGVFSTKQMLKEKIGAGFELDGSVSGWRNYMTGAGYNPNNNTLTLFAVGIDIPKVPANWNFEAECKQVLFRMRIYAGYSESDNRLITSPSLLMQLFADNFRGNLDGDIAESTVVSFSRRVSTNYYTCTGSLMSDGFEITQE